MTQHKMFAGTSGLVLPVPQSLYPPEFQGKSRLTYYASLFNSLEVNSSFYKTPQASTVAKWSESVPENFQFTFKLSKAVTHAKSLHFNAADIDRFIDVINCIGNKKGCLLIQLPPALKIDYLHKLQDLLECLQNADPLNTWRRAIEFRNVAWYTKSVYNLLEAYNVSLVLHDLPASATPTDEVPNAVKYLRFHGPGGTYRGSYENRFLADHAAKINDWLTEGKEVYFYFNNTMGDALVNLQTLIRYVSL
jgi:uncharacterized protein YecE (DUF72 family)